jgi:hypothetical protein
VNLIAGLERIKAMLEADGIELGAMRDDLAARRCLIEIEGTIGAVVLLQRRLPADSDSGDGVAPSVRGLNPMPGYTAIRTAARDLAHKATDPQIKALAELIVRLVDEVARVDRTVKDAPKGGGRFKSGS